ncbi:hypothetical protein SHIRM173S_02418 [Streptomyces hirsutus]
MRRAVELFAAEAGRHQRSYALNLIGMATVHLLQREPEQERFSPPTPSRRPRSASSASPHASERRSTRPSATSATGPRSSTSPSGSPSNCRRPPKRSDARKAHGKPTEKSQERSRKNLGDLQESRGTPGKPRTPAAAGPPELPDSAPPMPGHRKARRGRPFLLPGRPPVRTPVHRRLRHDNDRRVPHPAVHRRVTPGAFVTAAKQRGASTETALRESLGAEPAHPHDPPASPRTGPTNYQETPMAPAITLAAEAPTLSAANTGLMLICSALGNARLRRAWPSSTEAWSGSKAP